MTIDDLMKVYEKAWCDNNDHTGGRGDNERAGVLAVLIVLRQRYTGLHYGNDIILDLNGIIAKEAVPGGNVCQSSEHAKPETASNDERKV